MAYRVPKTLLLGITTAKLVLSGSTTANTGCYPELVFLSVVISNSTVSAVLIPNTSVF